MEIYCCFYSMLFMVDMCINNLFEKNLYKN